MQTVTHGTEHVETLRVMLDRTTNVREYQALLAAIEVLSQVCH